jgi:antitoxin component YwqK of YwqJK toxin-antitoxin module
MKRYAKALKIVIFSIILGGCLIINSLITSTESTIKYFNLDGQEQTKTEFYDKGMNGQIVFYKNRNKVGEINFLDKKNSGKEIWWHHNGHKKLELHYQDGSPHGLSTLWNEKGEIIKIDLYDKGKLIQTMSAQSLHHIHLNQWFLNNF